MRKGILRVDDHVLGFHAFADTDEEGFPESGREP